MYHILAFISKKPSLTTDEFIDYYENVHIPLVLEFSASTLPILYKRRYVKEPVFPGMQVDFDAVTELIFKDRAGFDDWMQAMAASGGRIAEDEAKFLDSKSTRAFETEEYSTDSTKLAASN